MSVDPQDLSRQFLELVFPALTVIYLDQIKPDAPRPATPYIGMLLDSDQPDGWQTPEITVEDTGVSVPPAKFPEHAEWAVRGQLLAAFYGPGSVARARQARLAPSTAPVQEFMQTEGIAFNNAVTVTNTAEILDTTREARATVQFDVSYIERVTTQVDVIETFTPVLELDGEPIP